MPSRDPEARARRLTPSHAKATYALRCNLERFFELVPTERTVFVTLGLAFAKGQKPPSAREASRRMRRLKEAILRDQFTHWIGVTERSSRQLLHFHFLMGVPFDARTGFDFKAFDEAQALASRREYGHRHRECTRVYTESAHPDLRQLWRLLRRVAPHYGFFRPQAVPVKTNAEAVAAYVSKYIQKHVGQRLAEDRKAKTILMSQSCRRATQAIAWASPGAKAWRQACASVAGDLQATSTGQLAAQFGPRWAMLLSTLIFRRAEDLAASRPFRDDAGPLDNPRSLIAALDLIDPGAIGEWIHTRHDS